VAPKNRPVSEGTAAALSSSAALPDTLRHPMTLGWRLRRMLGAVLIEARHEWQLQHRHMVLEARREMLSPAHLIQTEQLPSQGRLTHGTSSS